MGTNVFILFRFNMVAIYFNFVYYQLNSAHGWLYVFFFIKKPCLPTRSCPKSYSHRANSNYPLIQNYLWFNIHLSIHCSEQYFFVVRSVHHHHLPVPVCGHVWRRRSRSHTVVVRTFHGHQGEEVHGQEVRKWSKTSLSEVL